MGMREVNFVLVLTLFRYATDVVRECSEAWEKLITGKTASGGVST